MIFQILKISQLNFNNVKKILPKLEIVLEELENELKKLDFFKCLSKYAINSLKSVV